MSKSTTMPKRTGSIKYPLSGNNPALDILDDSFWKKMIIAQNRNRGQTYEQMAALVVRHQLLEEGYDKNLEVLVDKKWYWCFDGQRKKRRFDLYVEDLDIAYEVKSYRVGSRAFIKEQIRKDRWLIHHGHIKEVRWLLFAGATPNIYQLLTDSGIIYLDVGGDAASFTNLNEVVNYWRE